jgi:[ribosomal protein S5]-alanine N-acetyltransferase
MPSERLETERLILRPPQLADVPYFVPLIADYEVAKNLSSVPHPYTEEAGFAFIARAADKRSRGEDYAFAVLRKNDDAYVGACGVHPERNWEFGYWIGKPYWGHGYATEAARRLIAFAFEELDTDYLTAGWFHDNPASSRVLAKLGCVPAGTEERDCLARAGALACNKVVLTRAMWAGQGSR